MAETALDRNPGALEQEDVSVEIPEDREGDARVWLKDFFKREGLDKTGMARRLGLGKDGRTVVTKFLSDKDCDEKTNFARIVLATERLRAQVDGPEGISKHIGFRETRCVKSVWKHLNAVRDGHLLGAVVGTCGAGKTEALREAARRSRYDGKAPIRLIRCRVSMNMPSLIRKLARDMGLVEAGGDHSELHEDIVRKLSSHPEFLIFDEADYLTYNERCLQFLRDLHAETGTGLLLAGQLYFLSYIWGKAAFNGNGKEDGRVNPGGSLAPFADRLAVEVAPGLDDEEIVDIAEDVLKMSLTEKASAKLTFYVDHNFRVLRQVLLVMHDMRMRAGKTIDEKVVEAAWRKSKHIKAKQ